MVAAAAPVAVPAPASAAACSGSGGVVVVVDFKQLGDGISHGCAPGGRSASAIFADAGVRLTYAARQPGFVCRVQDAPVSDPCVTTSPGNAYWGLFWSDGTSGSWTYSSFGVGGLTVPEGGYVAFAWQGQSERALPGVAASPRAAVTTPTPTPTATPPASEQTIAPTRTPSRSPTRSPSSDPARTPSGNPTRAPSGSASGSPTSSSTKAPSTGPSSTPAATDSDDPGVEPTSAASPRARDARSGATRLPGETASSSADVVPQASEPPSGSTSTTTSGELDPTVAQAGAAALPTWVPVAALGGLALAGAGLAVARRRSTDPS